MRFKIDWASLTVERKFTIFALFYFVFEGNFQIQAPGGLYKEGRFNGRLFALEVWGGLYLEGLIFEILRIDLYATTSQNVSSDISFWML